MHELSERHGVKMQQIALAWHWAKGVASPIAGAIDHNPAEGVMLLDENAMMTAIETRQKRDVRVMKKAVHRSYIE